MKQYTLPRTIYKGLYSSIGVYIDGNDSARDSVVAEWGHNRESENEPTMANPNNGSHEPFFSLEETKQMTLPRSFPESGEQMKARLYAMKTEPRPFMYQNVPRPQSLPIPTLTPTVSLRKQWLHHGYIRARGLHMKEYQQVVVPDGQWKVLVQHFIIVI